ncbi:EF-hand-like domain protein [Ophiocordyceps camponoti-floridani]|uniref:EF-hand-like domain protein n=1 Tax=Ophiocordyceps camponoti-floridani TaxID=2030778 RepID=A0A8H4Q4W9_9HYPO|nr:EF-hand-like domain protein [Ophiocordyceps camponoti-floridani]
MRASLVSSSPALASIAIALAADAVLAHGGSDAQKPIVDDSAKTDWMTRHMAEEHHITTWDAESFFSLHDYNADGIWQVDEIQRTYGLLDPSNKDVSHERKEQVTRDLLALLDTDADSTVTLAEWKAFLAKGKTLPDMGTGPGHHGDDEYEYEMHHWAKYHDENTKLEDLTHPEDIEHFKKHEEEEKAAEAQQALDQKSIVEENIPSKFRRRN